MSSSGYYIILAETLAQQAVERPFDTGKFSTCVIVATGLTGAEAVPVLVLGDQFGNYEIACDANGDPISLTATSPSMPLTCGPRYAITKPATANASQIGIWYKY